MSDYYKEFLGHALPTEHQRLLTLESLWDPTSISFLDLIDFGEEWHCLELGAGAGSITRYLASRVLGGKVTATDIDVRFLPHDIPNVTIDEQDICVQAPPPAAFDLIHARALLEHLHTRKEILNNTVRGVRPGGWLVVEGLDITIGLSSPHAVLRKVLDAIVELVGGKTGADLTFGRSVPKLMSEAGLTEIAVRYEPIVIGDREPGNEFLLATLQQISAGLIARGLLDTSDLDEFHSWLRSPGIHDIFGLMCCTRGRKVEYRIHR